MRTVSGDWRGSARLSFTAREQAAGPSNGELCAARHCPVTVSYDPIMELTMPQAVYNTVRPINPQTVSFNQIGKSSILISSESAARLRILYDLK